MGFSVGWSSQGITSSPVWSANACAVQGELSRASPASVAPPPAKNARRESADFFMECSFLGKDNKTKAQLRFCLVVFPKKGALHEEIRTFTASVLSRRRRHARRAGSAQFALDGAGVCAPDGRRGDPLAGPAGRKPHTRGGGQSAGVGSSGFVAHAQRAVF